MLRWIRASWQVVSWIAPIAVAAVWMRGYWRNDWAGFTRSDSGARSQVIRQYAIQWVRGRLLACYEVIEISDRDASPDAMRGFAKSHPAGWAYDRSDDLFEAERYLLGRKYREWGPLGFFSETRVWDFGPVSRQMFTCPLWVPFAASWIPVALRLPRQVRKFRSSRLAAAGRCRECGYDLRASAARCPECGAQRAGAKANLEPDAVPDPAPNDQNGTTGLPLPRVRPRAGRKI